jgi:hypothetical protein
VTVVGRKKVGKIARGGGRLLLLGSQVWRKWQLIAAIYTRYLAFFPIYRIICSSRKENDFLENVVFESNQIYPFVVRTGKPRVQTTFQFRATLGNSATGAEQSFRDASRIILAWINEKYPVDLPQEAFSLSTFDVPEHGQKLECVSLPEEGIWSVLLEQPDAPMKDRPAVAGRVWTTEIALRMRDEVEFGIRVHCASLPYSEQPITLTRPRVVVDLAKKIGLRKVRPIDDHPWIIEDTDQLHELYDLLQTEKRFLPVIVLSETNPLAFDVDVKRFLVDEIALARRALGMAYLAVLTKDVAYQWTKAVGKEWTVYHGAVRTYYPGLDFDRDNPFLHPRVLPQQILFWKDEGQTGEDAFSRFLINKIQSRNIKDRMEWGRLVFLRDAKTILRERERIIAEEGLSSLVKKTAEGIELRKRIDEMLHAHQRELNDARELARRWEQDAERFNDDALESQKRKRELLDENHHLRGRLDSLSIALSEKTGRDIDDDLEIPETLEELPEWVRKNLAGRLVLHNRALRGIKAAAFENASLVYECLLTLAKEYRNMRIYGGGKDEFESRLQELQVEDRRAISDIGAGMNDEEYDVRYPDHSNKKRRLERHLCKGNSHDPRYTLRIYFFWDDDTSQVVVGWLPGHLTTGQS